jgi:hypothetical protein
MKGTLVVQILNTRGSFMQNRSEPADELADTVQFWVTDSTAWRIRTWAIDHDIHVYQLGHAQIPGEPVEWLRLDSQKHFEDEIAAEHVLRFENARDETEVQEAFRAIGLDPRLEVTDIGFCFWKPDDAKYHTQSTPKWANS